MARWGHAPLLDVTHAGVKVYCACGAQTKREFGSIEDAQAAHEEHVGLKKLQALKQRFDDR